MSYSELSLSTKAFLALHIVFKISATKFEIFGSSSAVYKNIWQFRIKTEYQLTR